MGSRGEEISLLFSSLGGGKIISPVSRISLTHLTQVPLPQKKEEGKKGHTILISRKEEEEEVSVCPRVEEGNRVEEEEEEESNSFPLSPLGNFSSANSRRARLSFVCSLPLSSPSDFAGEEEKK